MLEEALKKYFHYDTFRPGQREVIEAVLQEKDVIALLPTGSGKSLCYQLSGYLLNGAVVIVSPLLSLMQDQVEQMKRFGEKRVVAINSFLQGEQRERVLANLQAYRYIFVSPEMLGQKSFKRALSRVHIALIAVDEAHCISQWGFDFRPEYLNIGDTIRTFSRVPVLALTATATNRVKEDIRKYLHMENPYEWISAVDRPNICYQVVPIQKHYEKMNWLVQHVQNTISPGIIYTQSRKKTEEYAEALRESGVRVAAYHAGIQQDERQLIQHQFIAGELDWIVATNAFGMGVHKENIRQIIHDHLPSSMGNYLQEVGRAGRDGEQSFATLLFTEEDDRITKSVSVMDYPQEFHIDEYERLANQGVNPFIMVEESRITETSYRILHYWMHKLPKIEVIEQINRMKFEKVKEVDQLQQILTGKDCIREEISRYFEQELLTKPVLCCSVCGLPEDLIPKKRLIKEASAQLFSWQERFKQIFPN